MSPSINHSYLCRKILLAIEQSEHWEAWPELSLDIDNGVIPDLAVYERGALRPDFKEDHIKCTVLPRLIIEVASPTQTMHELMLKAERLLKVGIPAIWTIEPYGKIIYVSTPHGRKVELAGVIEYDGLRVDFARIFDLEPNGARNA